MPLTTCLTFMFFAAFNRFSFSLVRFLCRAPSHSFFYFIIISLLFTSIEIIQWVRLSWSIDIENMTKIYWNLAVKPGCCWTLNLWNFSKFSSNKLFHVSVGRAFHVFNQTQQSKNCKMICWKFQSRKSHLKIDDDGC